MVHQLLLVSKIPHKNYIQTVSTLQALTGITTPQAISTYTLVTKPHNEFRPKAEAGKVNQIEQYYMKCITTWSDEASEKLDISQPILKEDNDSILVDRLFMGDDNDRHWTLQISDIPVAGKNQTCSAQTIYESTLVHHHTKVKDQEKNADKKDTTKVEGAEDVMEVDDNGFAEEKVSSNKKKDSFLQFLEDLGYDVINQYWLSGIRFFHNDIIIEIFKILIRDDETSVSNDKIKLKLLDDSNEFQVRAYINVPKSTDVELISQGAKDLARFQDFLKNLIQLEIPDRMYMDSRVMSR